MTPAEHYDMAETLLRMADQIVDNPEQYADPDAGHARLLAEAQVHATLATVRDHQ